MRERRMNMLPSVIALHLVICYLWKALFFFGGDGKGLAFGFLLQPQKLRIHQRRTQWLTSSLSSATTNNDNIPTTSPSLIEQARTALQQHNDTDTAYQLLMQVSSSSSMSTPGLLSAFELLFRTRIALQQENRDNNALDIVLDRMGLASLLNDQGKYQEAALELELAAAQVTNDDTEIPQGIADKVVSMWFRSKAAICDWTDYGQASRQLVLSTRQALRDSVTTTPVVHPFEALTWPCITLEESTRVAHAYAMRAVRESAKYLDSSQQQSSSAESRTAWSNLEERLSRTEFPSVAVETSSKSTIYNTPPMRPIKLGYISPDFTGKHPLAFLMQDAFRFHDTQQFEVFLYSLEESDGSTEVEKIRHSGNWKVLQGDPLDMAQAIRNDNLDIVIDLCGYTGTSTIAEVMSLHKNLAPNDDASTPQQYFPPIHVAYMGYPGSSGAPYIDYMIADRTVVPSHLRKFYSESILFMPHCYFVNSHRFLAETNAVNDNKASSSGRIPLKSKSDYALPPSPAFVFCCHSRPDKIDPATFHTWIRALQRTRQQGLKLRRKDMKNAVLWLLRSDPVMEENLRRAAQSIWNAEMRISDLTYVSSESFPQDCLVFCDKAPRDEHLQRLSLADVFLDTPAYNAHTVGCDCLAAGVPMISLLRPDDKTDHEMTNPNGYKTVLTDKLASRVGASLLKSVGGDVQERLVVKSMKEYEGCMIDCAFNGLEQERQYLKEVSGREDGSTIAPLWDTERWVKNLEEGLHEMVSLREERKSSGLDVDIHIVDGA